MSEQAENVALTVIPANITADSKVVTVDVTGSDHNSSSNVVASEGNNVSFLNISYTMQPQSIKSLFKKRVPPKKILDDVRYV